MHKRIAYVAVSLVNHRQQLIKNMPSSLCISDIDSCHCSKTTKMASVPFLGIKTHSQKVCSLYKRALRNLEAYYDRRNVYRYQAVLLRERFDKNAKEVDMIKAVELLKAGEQELFLVQHPIPRAFATSMGGVAHERVVTPPDWVIDYWHPLEKAHYPEYFKRREQRKKEFIAMWEKEHGPADKKEEKH